ncbi:MAG: large conductance mechanosensitive channel protein MscL [Ktedonobacteraceae bacterium]
MAVWQNPNVARIGNGAKNTLGGFRAFILRGNVVDLAVGIVIGVAFTSVITAFVKDVVSPLIGGAGGFAYFAWTIPLPNKNSILIGDFINAIVSFLLTAFIVYFFVVRPVTAFMARHKKAEPEPSTTRDCPFCLSDVPKLATRCPYCTSPLQPVVAEAPGAAPAQQQA